MLEDIKKIADRITLTVKNDTYGRTVRPDYLRESMFDYPTRGGKRLRPALFFWCYEMVGGHLHNGLDKCAAAIEIWHNWTLVHDDIIDGDIMRRNSPTAHMALADVAKNIFENDVQTDKYGRDMAILCGDLQQGWAVDMLIRGGIEAELPASLVLEMVRRFELRANIELVSGEALDVEFAAKTLDDIEVSDILHMIDLKTGALFRCSCELGAMAALGYGKGWEFDRISDFARYLGRGFQLQDDILGTFGEEKKLGKDIGSDLRERKPTVLLLKSLEMADDISREIIMSVLGREEISKADVDAVRNAMQRSGAYDYVRGEVDRCFAHALDALSRFPMNKGRKNLETLIEYLYSREK